ncbi:MAG: PAS domain S-box protein [Anaerolineales bacterium]|nr:PAS domain S-box protein [Anaerolineales bacterium]
MLTSLRRSLAAPIFEDEEKTRTAFLLNTLSILILVTLFLGITLSPFISLLVGSPLQYAQVFSLFVSRAGLLILITLLNLVLLRLGYVRQASMLFVFFAWLLVTYNTYRSGGVQSLSYLNFLLPIIIAGLFLGIRAAFFYAALSFVAGGIILTLFNNNQLPPYEPLTPVGAFILGGISFSLTALIISLYVRRLTETLGLLQKANKELELVGKNLEKRVEERTRALTSSAEISRQLSTLLNPDQLMLEVVEKIKTTYNYYHGQIYLLDNSKKNLVLAGATGDVGKKLMAQGHFLPLERGLVGRVARTRLGLVVPDTSQNPDWVPNPLLPDTKAEVTVPILLGNELLGVLDMQDNQVGDVTEEDLELIQAIANQVAIALQNARQYEETQLLFRASQAIATANSYQEMLEIFMNYATPQADQGSLLVFENTAEGQLLAVDYAAAWSRDKNHRQPIRVGSRFAPEQIPFIQFFANNQALIISDIHATPGPQSTPPEIATVLTQFGVQAMAGFPLTLGGKLLGAILFGYTEPHTFVERELQPAQAITNQVAVLLRSQQLFAETEAALTQLDVVNRRLIGEGWREFTKLSGGIKVEDLMPGLSETTIEEIHKNPSHHPTDLTKEIVVPIMVRGEEIGVFNLQHLNEQNSFTDEDLELLQSVADEVAIALENLRLLEETQQNALALEESRNLLDAVIENLPLLLFVKDAKELRYIRWNKAGEHMLGIPANEVLGKNAYDSFSKEEADRFTAQDWEILSGEHFLDVAEETVETPRGTRILHTQKTPVYGPDGQARYLVGLSEDITERKQAEKALQDLEALYRRAIAAADAVPYSRRYADESFTFIGEGIEALTGFTAEEFNTALFDSIRLDTIIHSFQDLSHPDAVRLTRSGKQTNWKADYLIRTRDGRDVWLADTSVEIIGPDGKSTGSVGILTDITERKRAEETLNRQLKEMENLNTIGQIITTEPDLDSLLVRAGEKICEIFNVDTGAITLFDRSSDLIRTPFALTAGQFQTPKPSLLEEGDRLVAHVITSGKPFTLTEMTTDLAQKLRINLALSSLPPSWLGVPMLSGEEVLGVISVQTTTESHRFQDRDIRLLTTISANLSTAIQKIRLLEQTQITLTEFENLTRRLTHESWQNYLDTTPNEIGFVYDLNRVEPITHEVPTNGTTTVTQPLLVQGESIGQLVLSEIDELDEENQAILHAVSQQLSAHIENLRLLEQTEESRAILQKNEARLQVLVENTPDAFVTVDVPTGLFTDPNENAIKLFELPREELLKVGPVEMSPVYQPDGRLSAEKAADLIGQALETGETVVFDWTHINAQGTEIPCELRLVRLPGERPQLRASITDITLRKQAEAETRRLAQAVQSTADMVVITDLQGNIQFANNAFENVTGYKVEEAIGGNPRLLKSGVQGPDFYKTMWDQILSGKVWNGEVINRRKDGSLYTAQLSISPILNERNEIIQFVAVQRDITEQKRAEEALRLNEARLAEALQIARLGHWEYDVEKDLFTFNDQFYAIFRMTAEKAGGYQLSSARYAELFVYPDDMPVVGAEIEKALTSTERVYSTQVEHRIRYADGNLGYISVQLTVERDENGKITRYYGANQDITERKNAEIILRESEARLSEALRIARLGYWEMDLKTRAFTFDDHFYAIFHTTAQEMGGYQLSEEAYIQRLVYPEDAPTLGKEIEKALTTPDITATRIEHRIQYIDGGIGYVLVEANIERAENGIPLRIFGTTQDITELKQTEQALAESTHQIELILGTAGEGILGLDEHGKHVFVNPAAAQMLGYETQELIGQISHPTWHYSHPDGTPYPSEECPIFLTLRDGLIQQGEEYFWRKDGTGFPVSFTSQPIIERGKITGTVVTFQNITQQKQTQEILTRRASELQTVAALSTTASTVLNPGDLLQGIVNLSKERFNLYHAHIYLRDEAGRTLDLAAGAGEVGHQLVIEQHTISVDAEKSLVARAARERKAVIVNDVQADPGFLPNPLLLHTRSEMAIPMIVADKVLGVFDVQADKANYFNEEDANIFTTLASQVAVALQNARLYEEQAATVQRLRELDHLKSSFLANMSHELRTPLNSIIGFTEIILEGIDGPLTEFMEGDLKIIQKNGKHLLSLINDVLDMAKIEAGRMNLTYERFMLRELLEDVVDITTSLAHDKHLYIKIDPLPDEELELVADRIRLRQVLINIVGNAVKFTETGGITLRSEKKDGKLWLKVIDTGIGIPPEKLETVFDHFSQVDTSTTRKAGGTGLGLPISRRLVELHNGELWAESNGLAGEGSTFNLVLPLEFSPTLSEG